MRRRLVIGIWTCVGLTVVGFVLPWASLDVRTPGVLRSLGDTGAAGETLGAFGDRVSRVVVQVRRGAERVAGELPRADQIPTRVSGWRVPVLAQREDAKVAIALLELLTNTRQYLGAKSYAVYLVPGLALLAGGVVTRWPRRRAAVFATAGFLVLAAGIGFWKLLTTDTDSLFIAVTIGPGLWLSLWAYLGIAALAAGLGCVEGHRT